MFRTEHQVERSWLGDVRKRMHVGMWLPQLRGILLVLSSAIIQIGAQIISNTTLPSDRQVCPGEEVIFTCVVQGPQLAWSSVDYIGSGGKRLEFGTVDKLNKTKSYNYSSTVATLLSKSERNGVTEIESRLEIIASAKYSNSSVTCNDVAIRTPQPVHFNVIVPPDAPSTPEVVLRTDMTNFGNDSVAVTLEWSQFSGETYSIVAVPEPVNTSFIMSTRVQLVLLYNTEYNVTVTATLCGHSNATNIITIYYVDCRAPQFTRDDSNINVNYSSTLEGSTLQFSCVEGYLPSDVFIATCHPNGLWIPDPTSHTCTTASAASEMQNQNTANVTAIVISTVIVISVLIFIVGCACGWFKFGHKHKAKAQATPV